jgi:hypothetical protein
MADDALAKEVADAVLRQYRLLPKQGKPSGREWTVLAGFVLEQGQACHPD